MHSQIPASSADVIIERAVLLYAVAKKPALKGYYRILRPNGRISMQEPVNSFTAKRLAEQKIFFGYDFTPLGAIGDKILSAFEYPPDYLHNPMLNFDERDMLDWLIEAGFENIRMLYDAQLTTHARWPSFEAFLHSSPNPNAPTLDEAIKRNLTPKEQEKAIEYFRPLVKSLPAAKAYSSVHFAASK